MAKWIQGFPPSKSGSYLVKTLCANTSCYYMRCEYNVLTKQWIYHTGTVFHYLNHENQFWWDEYSTTEDKIIKKLKF